MACKGISFNGKHIAISGNGDIQTDEVRVNGAITRIMVRKRILENERLIQVLQTPNSIMLRVIDPTTGAGEILIAETLLTIPMDKVGQWLVLEYDVADENFNHRYFDERN